MIGNRKKIFTFAVAMPRWRNGRRARFRCECWEACRFESYSGHLKRSFLRRTPFSFAQDRTRSVGGVSDDLSAWVCCLLSQIFVFVWWLSLKMNFQPSSAKANNLRLQQPHFGRLSTAATVRVLVVGKSMWLLEEIPLVLLVPLVPSIPPLG